jgi:hypothetical protein
MNFDDACAPSGYRKNWNNGYGDNQTGFFYGGGGGGGRCNQRGGHGANGAVVFVIDPIIFKKTIIQKVY